MTMWFLLNHLSVKKQQLQDCMKQAKMFQYFLFVSNPTVNFWKKKKKIYQKESTLNWARVHRSGSFHWKAVEATVLEAEVYFSGDEHYVSPRSNKIMGILVFTHIAHGSFCWAHILERRKLEAQRTWYLSWTTQNASQSWGIRTYDVGKFPSTPWNSQSSKLLPY